MGMTCKPSKKLLQNKNVLWKAWPVTRYGKPAGQPTQQI